jgi:hypothetical protein
VDSRSSMFDNKIAPYFAEGRVLDGTETSSED